MRSSFLNPRHLLDLTICYNPEALENCSMLEI